MEIELEQIVTGCQKRQQMAQKLLYERFAPAMMGVCMRYTHSRDEAQDLLHDGFIKIFESIGTLNKTDSVQSWMYKIMVNVSLNYLAKKRHLELTDMDDLSDEDAQLADTVASAWSRSGYSMDDIVEAIQQLPEKYRVVFNMHEVEEMDYRVIAERLGMPESSVRTINARARRLLKDKLMKLK